MAGDVALRTANSLGYVEGNPIEFQFSFCSVSVSVQFQFQFSFCSVSVSVQFD